MQVTYYVGIAVKIAKTSAWRLARLGSPLTLQIECMQPNSFCTVQSSAYTLRNRLLFCLFTFQISFEIAIWPMTEVTAGFVDLPLR
jgi:hypothetical protein